MLLNAQCKSNPKARPNEYLARVIVLQDHESAGRPAYLLLHPGENPKLIDADERKIAAHRWQRASVNQVFYFEPIDKSSEF